MSRTYRLRHLPVLPGSARKFVEGIGITRSDKTEELIWKQVSEILGTPLRPIRKGRGWYRTAQWPSWHEFNLSYKIEKEVIAPVGALYKHPWVGYCCAGLRRKTWYKIQANRLLRHKNKELCNRLQPDFEGVNYFLSSEFFDPWRFD